MPANFYEEPLVRRRYRRPEIDEAVTPLRSDDEDAGSRRVLLRCPSNISFQFRSWPPRGVVPANPHEAELSEVHRAEVGADEVACGFNQIAPSFNDLKCTDGVKIAVAIMDEALDKNKDKVEGAVEGRIEAAVAVDDAVESAGAGARSDAGQSAATSVIGAAVVRVSVSEVAEASEVANTSEVTVDVKVEAESEVASKVDGTGTGIGIGIGTVDADGCAVMLKELRDLQKLTAQLEPLLWRHNRPASGRVNQAQFRPCIAGRIDPGSLTSAWAVRTRDGRKRRSAPRHG
jgi:hypothetical protein